MLFVISLFDVHGVECEAFIMRRFSLVFGDIYIKLELYECIHISRYSCIHSKYIPDIFNAWYIYIYIMMMGIIVSSTSSYVAISMVMIRPWRRLGPATFVR